MSTKDDELRIWRAEAREYRWRTYKIASAVAVAAAMPVLLLEQVAPWIVTLPICLGAALVIAADLKTPRRVEDSRKSGMDATVLAEAMQNNRFVIANASFYISRPRLEIVATNRESLEQQVREVAIAYGSLSPARV